MRDSQGHLHSCLTLSSIHEHVANHIWVACFQAFLQRVEIEENYTHMTLKMTKPTEMTVSLTSVLKAQPLSRCLDLYLMSLVSLVLGENPTALPVFRNLCDRYLVNPKYFLILTARIKNVLVDYLYTHLLPIALKTKDLACSLKLCCIFTCPKSFTGVSLWSCSSSSIVIGSKPTQCWICVASGNISKWVTLASSEVLLDGTIESLCPFHIQDI